MRNTEFISRVILYVNNKLFKATYRQEKGTKKGGKRDRPNELESLCLRHKRDPSIQDFASVFYLLPIL